MTSMVNCVLLKREAEAWNARLIRAIWASAFFENVSKEAWQKWMGQQTILMNEYRLSPINPKDRKFLEEEMDKFFFGEGASKVDNHTPPA
ncbi:MAG: oxidative damage protection protein [Thiolinea sp.]